MATFRTEPTFDVPEQLSDPEGLHLLEPTLVESGLIVEPESIGRSMLTSVHVFPPHKKGSPTTLHVRKEGIFSMTTVRHAELLPLADFVALEMTQDPFSEWSEDEIIGLAQDTGHDVKEERRLEFLNILSLHPNVTATEDDTFETSDEPEFKPFTEDFDPDSILATHSEDNEGLSNRKLGMVLRAMREDPDYKRIRLEKSRIANPRRRGELKPKERVTEKGGVRIIKVRKHRR
ncbi:MAG: hypothetical protein ACHQT9_00185 [Candidatus Saccharimonadales bacterium]